MTTPEVIEWARREAASLPPLTEDEAAEAAHIADVIDAPDETRAAS